MNIYVYYRGKLITYPDLPDNTDAEEYVADHYPLGEIQWGEYKEERVIYDDCHICTEDNYTGNRVISKELADNVHTELKQLGKTRYEMVKDMEQTSKQMEQDEISEQKY